MFGEQELAGALEDLLEAYQVLDDAPLLEEAVGGPVRDPRYVYASAVLSAWRAEQPTSPAASTSAVPSSASEVHYADVGAS